MNSLDHQLKASVIEYCATVGADPLLVQGAGGNVSWKDGDTLWVKASGTWLAEAAEKDIFVPVDLPHLRRALASGDFSVKPRIIEESPLKPSIETLLHALMRHRVVVHLHAIEVLAHLVRADSEIGSLSDLDASIYCVTVDYHKPGVELAEAVNSVLANSSNANVIFLKNHGVIVGGEDIATVSSTLDSLITYFRTRPIDTGNTHFPEFSLDLGKGVSYVPVTDVSVHQLATNPRLFERLSSNWALYPDHVVFLGAAPHKYKTIEEFKQNLFDERELPDVVFLEGLGVFVLGKINRAKLAQLRCFYDVLSRQPNGVTVRSLTEGQVLELTDWDAEKYRQRISMMVV